MVPTNEHESRQQADRADTSLRRQLGLRDGVAIYVGVILGSGIFFAPSDVAAVAPGLLQASLFWLVGGFVAVCGAFCYAECGARLPWNGGFYIYYREVFGESLAFVGGWVALLVTYPASIAAMALIFGSYLGEAIPVLQGHEPWVASAGVAVAAFLNAVGVRVGARSQQILTGIKVVAICLVCLAAVVVGVPATSSSAVAPSSIEVLGPLSLGALVAVLWTYSGWSDVTLVAGELRDPAKSLGRTVLLGTVVLVGLYCLVQAAVVVLLTPEQAAASTRVLSDAVGVAFGPLSSKVVAWLVVICTFGAINGTVLTTSRLGHAMALDEVIPRWFGQVHHSLGTPTRAIVGILVVATAYASSSSFRQILGLFTFSVWIFYGVTAVALLKLRYRKVGEPLAWRAPWGSVPPAVVLLTGLGMTIWLLYEPNQRLLAGIGLVALLAGWPAYYLWRWIHRKMG